MVDSQQLKPLLIWQSHNLTEGDAERIKNAKRKLNLPYMAQLAKATPESDGRVVAIGSPPPFPCDYFMVQSTLDSNLKDAVEWALGERPDDFRIVTIVEMLEDALGGPVVEVTNAENELNLDGLDRQSARLPDHDERCSKYGSTADCGERGCIDPGNSSEREYRGAIREARIAAEGAG